MTLALFGTLVLASLFAWFLSTRRQEHRPVAILLTAGLALDIIDHVYDLAVIAPLRGELGLQAPWTGWARVAGAMADAIGLLWPAALVGAAFVVFLGKRPWPALVGWAVIVLWLTLAHPMASDGTLARYLAAAESIGAAVAVGIAIQWFVRTTKAGNSAQLTLAIITLAEVISLLGTWRVGVFQNWMISQALYLMMLVSVIIAQGRILW